MSFWWGHHHQFLCLLTCTFHPIKNLYSKSCLLKPPSDSRKSSSSQTLLRWLSVKIFCNYWGDNLNGPKLRGSSSLTVIFTSVFKGEWFINLIMIRKKLELLRRERTKKMQNLLPNIVADRMAPSFFYYMFEPFVDYKRIAKSDY